MFEVVGRVRKSQASYVINSMDKACPSACHPDLERSTSVSPASEFSDTGFLWEIMIGVVCFSFRSRNLAFPLFRFGREGMQVAFEKSVLVSIELHPREEKLPQATLDPRSRLSDVTHSLNLVVFPDNSTSSIHDTSLSLARSYIHIELQRHGDINPYTHKFGKGSGRGSEHLCEKKN